MWQVYVAAKPDYSGRVTVPVLWDKKNNTVVSNESSEIIRMFNSAFNAIARSRARTTIPLHCVRASMRSTKWSIHNVNNGVYKSGFATTQEAYEEQCRRAVRHT
jgi:putative glutathione S-transferase